MAKSCSICQHPDLSAINSALLKGHSVRRVATRYSLSKSAVGRHSLHAEPETLLVRLTGDSSVSRLALPYGDQLQIVTRHVSALVSCFDYERLKEVYGLEPFET